MSAVINKSVDSFLKHTLLVLYDYFGSHELRELFKTVVSVDYSSVKVIEVGRCVSAAVKGHHRSDFRRDNGDNVKYHPFGLVSRTAERLDNLKSLDYLELLLTGSGIQLRFQLFGKLFDIYFVEKLFYSLCAHTDAEIVFVFFIHVAIFAFGKHLLLFKRSATRVKNYILRKVEHFFKCAGRDIKYRAHS